MSSLEKLAIRGIRSFDPKDLAVMQFYTPLTVIVGHNGSGKTTIIECLKFATTGDLPPNTKGGAFIHDPAIENEKTVHAQVKLRFKNVNKDRMIVDRRLQVSVRKTGTAGLTMKTLEGTLSFEGEDANDKKRRSTSSRCSDINLEVPLTLGVSKAILENVIFCHQEESNWPLSEPAALKKKFDDIFEATKYTKALDQIKVIRKEMAVEIKVDKEKLVALKTDRDRAKKLQGNIDKITITIADKTRDYETLDEEVKSLYDSNQKLWEQATKYETILHEARTLDKDMKNLHETMQGMLDTMKPLDDHDSELQHRLDNFVDEMNAFKRQHAQLEDESKSARQAIDKLERSLQAEHGALGGVQAEMERHESNIQERQKLAVSLAGRHNISGYDRLPLSPEQIEAFLSELSRSHFQSEKRLKDHKTSSDAQLEAKREAMSKLRSQASEGRAQSNSLKQQIQNAQKESRSLQTKIESSSVTEGDVASHQTSFDEKKAQHSALEGKYKEANYERQLTELKRERDVLRQKRQRSNELAQRLQTDSSRRSELKLKRDDRLKKEELISSLLDAFKDAFRKHVGREMTRENMRSELRELKEEKTSDLQGVSSVVNSLYKDSEKKSAKAAMLQSNINDLQETLESEITEIKNALGPYDSVQAALDDCDEEIETRQKDISVWDAMTTLYDRIQRHAQRDGVCIGCNRGIEKDELPDLSDYVKEKVATLPERKAAMQEELDGWREELEKWRKLQERQTTCDRIEQKDLPNERQELEAAEKDSAAAFKSYQSKRQQEDGCKTELAEIQELLGHAEKMTSLNQESKQLARDIDSLEGQLLQSGATETLEDVTATISQLDASIETCQDKVNVVDEERSQARDQMQKLKDSMNQATLALTNAKNALQQRQTHESRRTELSEVIERHQNNLEGTEKQILETQEPLRKLEEELTELRKVAEERQSALQKEKSTLQRSMDQMNSISEQIDLFERCDAPGKLERTERKIKDLGEQIRQRRSAERTVLDNVDRVKSDIASASNVEANIRANQLYRAKQRKERETKAAREALDVPAAEKAHRRFNEDFEAGRQVVANKNAALARLGGEVETLKKQSDDIKEQLNEEYKNVKSEYREQLIKVKVGEFSVQDLEKYGKALDTAIMRYHEQKMQEINESISSLWTKTYQGTDIDTIMIKSDSEGVTKNGRSYNYRVVMVKDQVEMDMRGRCSAGQKVLASIIIRLALAESFGTNCGILALDEPTTNLDKDNIQSLAAALADIIRERRSQSNFQLIVITHDEELLTELGRADVLDRFWRVSRDYRQKSVIERQRVEDLQ